MVKHEKCKNIVSPGEGYVLKNPNVAFESPFIQFSILNETLKRRWLNSRFALREWSEHFEAATSNLDESNEDPITQLDLSIAKQNKRLQLEYKTPVKRVKIKSIHPTTKPLKIDLTINSDPHISTGNFVKIITDLDNQIQDITHFSKDLKLNAESESDHFHKFSTVTETKFSNLFTMFSKKSKLFRPDLEAKTVCQNSKRKFKIIKQSQIKYFFSGSPTQTGNS